MTISATFSATSVMSRATSGVTSHTADTSAACGRGIRGLSFVAETGDGCRIYRHTSGLYAVCAPGSDRPGQTAATLACAYAACQAMAGQRMADQKIAGAAG